MMTSAKSLVTAGNKGRHSRITTSRLSIAAASLRDQEDEALMRRVQTGDNVALAVLFHRYSRLVLSVGNRIFRDRAAAQDLVQDVFLYVLRRGHMDTSSIPAEGGSKTG